jgi:hypothetical protein
MWFLYIDIKINVRVRPRVGPSNGNLNVHNIGAIISVMLKVVLITALPLAYIINVQVKSCFFVCVTYLFTI